MNNFTEKHMTKLVVLAAVLLWGVIGFGLYRHFHKPVLGAISIPESPYLFITSLQSNIGTSDTSMTLNKGTLANGVSLTGYQCFTLDSGLATAEYTCGTASGTAISSLLRGIDPQNPAATSSALAFSHRASSDVRITDFPILQITKRLVNGQDAFPNKLSYGAAPTFTSGLDIVDKTYADALAIAGAPNGSTLQKGIYQEATSTQIQGGTAVGSTGADLIAPNSFFNQTSSAAVLVPVTNSSGKLSQGFLDLTASWTFAGTTTVSGSLIVNSATSTLNNVVLITAAPATTTAATNKNYVDNRFSYANSTTTAINSSFPTTGTTTITSIPYTPSIASRVMVTFVATFATGNSSGNGCTAALYIDNNLQTNASVQINTTAAVGAQGDASFTYITPQLTATSHTITITGQGAGATCSLATNPQMAIINIGN